MSDQTSPRTTLTINWAGIAGGALAAVTSAVVLAGLKSLGSYGPLVGAGIGSVLASTAAAIYSWSLSRSRERIAEAARRARERRAPNHPGGPEATPRPPGDGTDEQRVEREAREREAQDRADAERADAERADAERADADAPRARRRRITQVLLLGVVAFVLAVGAIAVYEVTTGNSVAAERQGTVSEGSTAKTIIGTTVTPEPVPTPEPTTSPTDPATQTATSSTSGTATDSPTTSPTSPASSSDTTSPSSSSSSSSTSGSPSSGSSSSSASSSSASSSSASSSTGSSSTRSSADGSQDADAAARPTGPAAVRQQAPAATASGGAG